MLELAQNFQQRIGADHLVVVLADQRPTGLLPFAPRLLDSRVAERVALGRPLVWEAGHRLAALDRANRGERGFEAGIATTSPLSALTAHEARPGR